MKRKWLKQSAAFALSVMLALGNTSVYADDSGENDDIATVESCSDDFLQGDENEEKTEVSDENLDAAVSEDVTEDVKEISEAVNDENANEVEEDNADSTVEAEIPVEEETFTEVFNSTTNEAAIWSFLTNKGLSEVGTAAIMGNLKKESGFQPNNLENSANNKSGLSDAEFTARVDNGTISRASFISSSQFGVYTYTNSTGTYYTYGYGLAQWTFYSRKAQLYDYWKKYFPNVSIGDLNMQLNYLYDDMGNYSGLRSAMISASDISAATVKFHNQYEGSADSAAQIQDRINYATDIYNRYHAGPIGDPSIQMNQYWYDPSDQIEITASAENASKYYYSLHKDGQKLQEGDAAGGKIIFSARALTDQYGIGMYSICVSCYNSNNQNGARDIWQDFDIVGAPSGAKVELNQYWFDKGDVVEVNCSAICAKTYRVVLEDENGKVIFEKEASITDSGATYTFNAGDYSVGNYRVKCIALNNNGAGKNESPYVSLPIVGPASGAKVELKKSNYSLSDSIEVVCSGICAKAYSVKLINADTHTTLYYEAILDGGNIKTFRAADLGTGRYKVMCTADNASGGSESDWVEFSVGTPKPLMRILSQPENISAGINGKATFSVTAENAASYQWQYSKNGVTKWINCSAAGNTTDTLSVTVTKSNSVNIYRCVVTGTDGKQLISNTATVDLLPGAVITLNPKSNAVAIGEYATFTVEAENAASYQWQYSKDGAHWYRSNAEGNQTDTLIVKGEQKSQGNRYRCVVTGIDGNIKKSYMAAMIVMTVAPKDCTAAVGQMASYTLKAEGIASYQWQYSKDGGQTWYKSSAEGATTDTVTFKASSSNRAMIYRCKLTTPDEATAYTKSVGFQ